MADRKEYDERYRERHKERIAESNRRWYEKNKAKALETGYRWREENREKVRAAARARYEADPERHREHQRKWRAEHPDAVRAIDARKIANGYNRVKMAARHAHPERQKCEVDDCPELGERHHDDYSRPKDIRWLCHRHHMALNHRKEG